jgi:hypothetical protein
MIVSDKNWGGIRETYFSTVVMIFKQLLFCGPFSSLWPAGQAQLAQEHRHRKLKLTRSFIVCVPL